MRRPSAIGGQSDVLTPAGVGGGSCREWPARQEWELCRTVTTWTRDSLIAQPATSGGCPSPWHGIIPGRSSWPPCGSLVILKLFRVDTQPGYECAFLTHRASARTTIPGLLGALLPATVFHNTQHLPRTPFYFQEAKGCKGLPPAEFVAFATSRSCLSCRNLEWPIEDSIHQLGNVPCKFRENHTQRGDQVFHPTTHVWAMLVSYRCTANCYKLSSLK